MECKYCDYSYCAPESTIPMCKVFGEDVPDGCGRQDGEGCKFNQVTLKKILRDNEKAWLEETKRFVEYMEQRQGEVTYAGFS